MTVEKVARQTQGMRQKWQWLHLSSVVTDW